MTPMLRTSLSALLAASVALPSAALAQSNPPPGGYAAAPGTAAPAGSAPPTGPYQDPALNPPAGYTPQDAQQDSSTQAQAQDRTYAAYTERWAAANCIRQQENNAAAGTVIGGILGAVIGSNIARGPARGAGAVVGAGLGAVAGNAIGRDANGGSCPPGFVLRPGPVVYAPPPAVVYAAPGWYNPWIWYDGRWIYRPYPYHRYWRGYLR
jgi:hypothetical protein